MTSSLLPAEFNTVALSGQYVNLDGSPVAGYLTFTPSPTILRAAASKDLIVPVVINVPLDGTGHFSVNLPATDDPDINPDGWTYQVLEGFGNRRTYSVQILLEAGTEQNIFDLAPVAMANGTYYELGPTGPAGPPALIVSGAPSSSVGGTGDYAIDPAAGVLYGPKDQSTGWPAGVHLSATDIAAHAALTHTHGLQAGSNLVGTTDTQTLSGKTLTAPVVTGGLTADTAHVTGTAQIDGNTTITGDLNAHNVTGNLGAFAAATVTATPANPADVVRKDYADALGDEGTTASTIVRRDASGIASTKQVYIGNTAFPDGSGYWATRKDYVDGQDVLYRRIARQSLAVAAYTLALTDEGTSLDFSTSAATTVTIPADATVNFPAGGWVEVSTSNVSTPVTIAPAAGVTLRAPDNNYAVRTVFSRVVLRKIAPNVWVLSGDNNNSVAQAIAAATPNGTASTLVQRDSGGGFTAGFITSTLGVQSNTAPAAAGHLTRKDYVDALGTSAATANTIVRRDASGISTFNKVLLTGTPSGGTDGTNKTYVDGQISGLGTSAPTANTVVKRDSNGNAQINSVYLGTQDNGVSAATRKDYVDAFRQSAQLWGNSGTQAIASSSTWTLVAPLGTAMSVNGSMTVDTATGKLIINTPGTYLVTGQFSFSGGGSGSRRQGSVYKNGAQVPQSISAFPVNSVQPIYPLPGFIIDCVAGDYLQLWVWQDTGGSWPAALSSCVIAAHRIY